MLDFEVGDIYFALKYLDSLRCYPRIDSYVYLGKDLSDDDNESTWYFEYIESYADGLGTPAHAARQKHVHCANTSDISDFMDAEGLTISLGAASNRRRSLGR